MRDQSFQVTAGTINLGSIYVIPEGSGPPQF